MSVSGRPASNWLEGVGLACQRGDALLWKDLNFSVSAGEALAIRGANGRGKTSLLRIAAGLSPAAAGTLRWNGTDLKPTHPAYRARLFYLGHGIALKDELGVMENLELALKLDACPTTADERMQALAEVGLVHRRKLAARYLSQGQKRRVALARLRLGRRALWLLDEPLAALDAEGVALFDRMLRAHLADGGMALITAHQTLGMDAAQRTLELN